ncbi:MAG TPA: TIGR03013 family XrtA/PEP-CTERM system glycosyltransferase [Rhizomicrobium sp.]|nr:TIGR03013 family XrtA/PEP-CTERM system glycosyltransferase [Rhizomicrobium sp.]
MSLDGVSQNNTQLNLAAPAPHLGKIDAFVRRGASTEAPAARVPRMRILPPAETAGAARRYPRYVPAANVSQALLDLVLIGGAQLIVLSLIHSRLALGGLDEAAAVVGISLIGSMLFLYATGCYRRDALLNRTTALSRIPTALAISGTVLFFLLHYGFPMVFPDARVFWSISRCVTIILVGTGISLGAAVISRNVVRVLLHNDFFRRRILVVGTGQRARHIEDLSRAHGGLQEIHFINEDVLTQVVQPDSSDPHIAIPSIGEVVDRLNADEIVVAVDDRNRVPLDSLLSCKARGVPVTEFNAYVERQTGRVELAWLELPWLIHTPGFQFRLIDDAVKRLMDIVLSLTALIISLPVLIAAMVAIRIDSPGSVIYRQQRVTRGGRVFWLYKLRSMRADAERNGAQWADQNDPRITKVGMFLRRSRLDEIPQLINILKGDMSIVGPRPERPCFVDDLSRQLRLYDLRHTVRAGLTGWAQINYHYGASLEDAQRKLEYDLFYIKNFSLLRDLGIMLQTLRVVLWPEGVR